MTATAKDIRRWVEEGKEAGATHVIIACDTFDWGNYPVNVMPGDDVNKEVSKRRGKEMQRVDEVYDMSMDIEEQLKPGNRVMNY